jgi:SNW domain-containing protein 1
MSLLATLPAPRHQPAAAAPAAPGPAAGSGSTALATTGAPPYPRRKGFVPRRQDDFADGGAYPELPLLQYPLDMGRPDDQKGGKTLAVSVDINGAANYDAILRQGQRANKVIHSGHQALVPKVDLLDPQVGQHARDKQFSCAVACWLSQWTTAAATCMAAVPAACRSAAGSDQ